MVAELQRALGADRVLTDPLATALYAGDAGTDRGRALAVCFPADAGEVAAAVRALASHGVPFVARGAGTGLAGGAVPPEGGVVIVTTRLNRILRIDPAERVAWVEPGVVNLDLTRAAAPFGLHYAPDPSSQAACTIGGNVGTNAGGPHCLAAGVTETHVLALDVVLPDGTVATFGGPEPDTPGYDLRGVIVGGEGTLGVVTRIALRLVPDAAARSTMLVAFASLDAACRTVSAVIAGGIVPGALEMMDRAITVAVEDFVGAGFPRDAAAMLLVEIEGGPAAVRADTTAVAEIAAAHGATQVRTAADAAERDRWWRGRRAAFGAVARVAPDYYLHDTVVPRTRLPEVLAAVVRIAAAHGLVVMNVFHAGDGNLHPLLVFDGRAPGTWARVRAAGEEIVRTCVAAGGTLSGEHGIGTEKRDLMPLVCSPEELALAARLRAAFDPAGLANPGKVLPTPGRCGEIGALGGSAPGSPR